MQEPEFKPGFSVGSVLLICLVSCVVLFCVFTFWVMRCDVRYDFRIKMMFGSPLSLVVCMGFVAYLRYLYFFVHSGVQHILCCVFVLLVFALCTLCCQFLWIINFLLPLRYSLTCNDNMINKRWRIAIPK